ncbi:NtaA/DmoA family FMN-dependent monooxygenase [Solihabitans fulvus]|uniref:NtaA/DmoA family FMN-dependent monooxygenase n=2 Tax=Solihabitans fulvus TaxID=1892852 RepID=A0A5B2XQ38_9PSEU|nr:NtaA/DmoA family FMN-dependent monooxygenase [Solihabitans fulvus]
MYLNVLTQCIPAPLFEGMWRHPEDQSALGYRSLDYWVNMAQQLESACIDALFFADIHGVYDVYQDSPAPSIQHSVQVPAIDPVLVIPAAAAATRNLGFAVSYSTSYHAPYQCARLFSSLDHLTGGRIGWNIVTSDLRLAVGTGLAEQCPHDERYDRADEYLDLVVRLWEDSWEAGAVRHDAASDTFADPARVHRVDHAGRWYRMSAPHQCEPSPQRTPVLYQAGSSDRGLTFAARHAELVFVALSGFRQGRERVEDLRDRARRQGRDPEGLRILQGMCLILGEDAAQARARAEEYERFSSRGGLTAKWCGWTGLDLASYPAEAPLSDLPAGQMRSVTDFLRQAGAGRELTVGDLREHVATPRRPNPHARLMLFGTPEQVADRMEMWLERTKIDGFNLMPCPPTLGTRDLCELLVPELQRRGLARKSYDTAERTLRERYFGSGVTRYVRAAENNGGNRHGG